VIGTLAVDEWAVTFRTARMGLGADTSLGLRRFSVAGPRVWNRLPHEMR